MPKADHRGRFHNHEGRRTGPDNEITGKGREMMRRFSSCIAALAAAASLLMSPQAFAAGTVKIGVLFPLTGNAGAAGQASKAALEVAAEIVNGKHPELTGIPLAADEGLPGLGGAKLDLVFVDHQGNPSVAQQQALRLVSQEKVNVLFGA